MRSTQKPRDYVEISSLRYQRALDGGGDIVAGNARDRRQHTCLYRFEAAYHRRQFTGRQYEAGAKFRRAWDLGGIKGALHSVNLDGTYGNAEFGFMPKTELEAHWRLLYRKAEEEIGMVSSAILRCVICEDNSFETAGYMLGRKQKGQAIAAAVERMRCALDQLAVLWGI